jgi:dTDP-L-rhamnose 4-epimerase
MKTTQTERKRIVVTGGAGFIGSHLVDELIELGHSVTIVDCLDSQVHPQGKEPEYLNRKAIFVKADIRTPGVLESVISNTDVIFHFAASTAVGQSMHQVSHYASNNIQATALLWDVLAKNRHRVNKVILASSRAVYGEGLYLCEECKKEFIATPRHEDDLKKGLWDIRCPTCLKFAKPVPAHEQIAPHPASIYAITKSTQEEISLCCAKALNVPVAVLRFSNVYGARQSLSNPYVGIASIFAANVFRHKAVEIYEDGMESRDFICAKDVVSACILAMNSNKANYQILNVGSGQVITILDLARTIIRKLNGRTEAEIVGKYRLGDIRHFWMDISKIRNVLGFKPLYSFDKGIDYFINWVQNDMSAGSCRQQGLIETV